MTVESEKGSIFTFFEKKDIPHAAAALACVIISSLGSPLQTIFYGQVFSKLSLFLGPSDYSYSQLTTECRLLSGYIMVVGAVRMVFSWLGMFLWMQFGEVQLGRARAAVYKVYLQKSFSWYDQQHGIMGSTSQINRCMEELRTGTSQEIGQLVKVIASIITLFVTAMVYSWSLTLVIIATTPLMALCGWYFDNLTFKASDKENSLAAEASTVLDWNFSHGDIVRMFNGKYEEMVKFEKLVDSSALAFYSLVNVAGINIGIFRTLALISIVQGMWFGSYMIKMGKLQINSVFTAFSSCILLGSNISMLSNLLVTLSKAQAAAGRINGVCAGEKTNTGMEKEIVREVEPAVGNIIFQETHFQYGSDRKVLNGISFNVQPRLTFIVGTSGSGKSTIALLLMKFYIPTEGSISIDGYKITTLDNAWLRRNVCLVDQSPVFFNGSVTDNIAVAANEDNQFTCEADVTEAMSFARIRFNRANISALSGGQKQKIALARARLRDPPILVLDEALSAIDVRDRLQIFDSIKKWRAGRTTVVITHDYSQIGDCDDVVVLEKGSVTYQGDFGDIKNSLNWEMAQDATNNKTKEISNEMVEFGETSSLENNKLEIMSVWSILKYCHRNIESKLLLALGLVMSVLSALASPVYSFCVSKLLQAMVDASLDVRGVEQELVLWSGIVISISCFDGLSHYLSMYILNYASEKFINSLRKLIFGKISEQDMSFFGSSFSQPAELTSLLMNDSRDMRNLVADFLSVTINLVAMLLCGTIWSIVAGWKLALVGICFVPLTLMITAAYSKLLTVWEARYKHKIVEAENFNRDTVIGLKTILSYGLQHKFTRTFQSHLDSVKGVATRRSIATGLGIALSELCTSLATGTVLYYGIVLVGKSEYTQGSMLQVITILTFTLANAVSLLDELPNITRGQRGGTYIIRLMKLCPSPVENNGCKTVAKFEASIRLGSVSLTYDSENTKALKGATFNILEGQRAVIAGHSGSGKSTIASVMMRLYPITDGFVRVSNYDILELDVFWLRQKISIVPQQSAFFEGTIYENLVYGLNLTKVLKLTILNALDLSNCLDFVTSMKDGLHTRIGSASSPKLSTGQLQRLSIARALVRNPRILLLDECTANLDPASTLIIKDLISDNLAKIRGLTIVLITHDKTMMTVGDNVIVMRDGLVVEQGSSFSSLYNLHGELYTLVKS